MGLRWWWGGLECLPAPERVRHPAAGMSRERAAEIVERRQHLVDPWLAKQLQREAWLVGKRVELIPQAICLREPGVGGGQGAGQPRLPAARRLGGGRTGLQLVDHNGGIRVAGELERTQQRHQPQGLKLIPGRDGHVHGTRIRAGLVVLDQIEHQPAELQSRDHPRIPRRPLWGQLGGREDRIGKRSERVPGRTRASTGQSPHRTPASCHHDRHTSSRTLSHRRPTCNARVRHLWRARGARP
jgi:hypothetical protein